MLFNQDELPKYLPSLSRAVGNPPPVCQPQMPESKFRPMQKRVAPILTVSCQLPESLTDMLDICCLSTRRMHRAVCLLADMACGGSRNCGVGEPSSSGRDTDQVHALAPRPTARSRTAPGT
eukprot:1103060-Rhodomonas_salina.3